MRLVFLFCCIVGLAHADWLIPSYQPPRGPSLARARFAIIAPQQDVQVNAWTGPQMRVVPVRHHLLYLSPGGQDMILAMTRASDYDRYMLYRDGRELICDKGHVAHFGLVYETFYYSLENLVQAPCTVSAIDEPMMEMLHGVKYRANNQ
jgi:hypothetical protein